MNDPFTPEGELWALQSDGQAYWLEDPKPENVSIEVIANSLSQKVRFGGQGWPFYSVAQHVLLVADIARKELSEQVEKGISTPYYAWAVERVALAHDFHETWMVDLPSPHKKLEWLNEKWREIEDRWDAVIFDVLNIESSDQIRKAVKVFDLVAMRLEGEYVMPKPPGNFEWPGHGASQPHIIELAEKHRYALAKYTGSDYGVIRRMLIDRWKSLETPNHQPDV